MSKEKNSMLVEKKC